MVQRVDDVEVFQSNMTVAITDDNNVLSATRQLFSGAAGELAGMASRRAAGRAAGAVAGAEGLSAEKAIAKAASDLTGHPYKPDDFEAAPATGQRTAAPIASTPANRARTPRVVKPSRSYSGRCA